MKDQWYEVHDTYLANPTDENLWDLLHAENRMTKDMLPANSHYFFRQKYRSVLMAQHLFRQEVTKGKTLDERPASASMGISDQYAPNPVWEVGHLAHNYREGKVGNMDFQIPPEIREGFHPTGTIAEEMHKIRVPWFYAGWLIDQGLQHSGGQETTKSGRYFTRHMHQDDGYPIHNIFVITRKIVVQNFDPPSGALLAVDYDNFNDWEFAMRYEPADSEAQAIYRLITENSYRMMLFLIRREITDNGMPEGSSPVVEKWIETVDDFEAFSQYAQTEHHAFNLQLVDEMRGLLGIDHE